MREIKFRAWDKKDKKWDEFELFKSIFCCWDRDSHPQERYENWGEYTGLKDKNGKEIYIGDVVQDKYDIKGNPETDTGRIDFINGCTCVTYFDLDEDEQRQYYPAYNGLKYYEVIGNIHENKELLK